jgi:hypothetical protein
MANDLNTSIGMLSATFKVPKAGASCTCPGSSHCAYKTRHKRG